ncbi:MAG: phage tail family protein [Eubacterium sp.]|jgi:predicted phage tail component-like protein|nr:phage tail family protein [Eubacterium sp.]
MIGAFSFNGIHASAFNLVCRSVIRPLLPPVKTRRVELSGVSGAYDYPSSEYDLRQITMRIIYIGENYYELRSRAREIAAWLAAEDFSKLIMDDENDKYYLAKVTSELDLSHFWESGAIDVIFDCQPFAYSMNAQNVIITGSGIITNPGTRKIGNTSPPGSVLTLTCMSVPNNTRILVNGGTPNVGYFIYGNETSVTTPAGDLIVDVTNMKATIGDQNAYPYLGGNIDRFFDLQPGNNTIAAFVGGTTTPLNLQMRVEYIPMWY